MRRLVASVAVLLVGILALATPVSAVVGYTLVGGPLASTMFTSTTYTFTATNLLYLNDIGCVEVQLPSQFVIESLGDPIHSGGVDWSAELYGGTNWVLAHSNSGGGRLNVGESVTFTITATATSGGNWFWNTHAHRQQDCTGPNLEDGVWPMVVNPITLPSIPPTPLPTAVPTPRPTTLPTPPPLPIDTPAPSPSASPSATSRPSATATARPTPKLVAVVPGQAPRPPGPAAPVARMAPMADSETSAIGLGTEVFGLLEGPLVWFVPSAVVGGPGLLILLFIALQAGGALAWIPAVRRMSGESVPVRRRRRPGG